MLLWLSLQYLFFYPVSQLAFSWSFASIVLEGSLSQSVAATIDVEGEAEPSAHQTQKLVQVLFTKVGKEKKFQRVGTRRLHLVTTKTTASEKPTQ